MQHTFNHEKKVPSYFSPQWHRGMSHTTILLHTFMTLMQHLHFCYLEFDTLNEDINNIYIYIYIYIYVIFYILLYISIYINYFIHIFSYDLYYYTLYIYYYLSMYVYYVWYSIWAVVFQLHVASWDKWNSNLRPPDYRAHNQTTELSGQKTGSG